MLQHHKGVEITAAHCSFLPCPRAGMFVRLRNKSQFIENGESFAKREAGLKIHTYAAKYFLARIIMA